MRLFEYLKKNFLDSCSESMHDLKQRREIIDVYKSEIKEFRKLLIKEDKSLRNLEDKN